MQSNDQEESYKGVMLREGALKGKVILVTGGGTGLGKAMATCFSRLGADIAIAGRREEKLRSAAEEIGGISGGKVLPVACDIREYSSVEGMLAKILDTYGRVDVLVNNAAGNFISPTEKLSSRAFDTVIDIVLKGTKNCTLAFGKHWIEKEQKNTSILNIVTTYSWTGSSFVVPSAMAKAGVLAMTRSLAVEWSKYGIRSNAIAPGPFPTEGAWSRLLPGNLSDKLDLVKQVPLRRAGEKEELANLASYLVSDYSAYVQGEVVTIDGGEWLQDAGQLNFLDQLSAEEWAEIGKLTKKGRK